MAKGALFHGRCAMEHAAGRARLAATPPYDARATFLLVRRTSLPVEKAKNCRSGAVLRPASRRSERGRRGETGPRERRQEFFNGLTRCCALPSGFCCCETARASNAERRSACRTALRAVRMRCCVERITACTRLRTWLQTGAGRLL